MFKQYQAVKKFKHYIKKFKQYVKKFKQYHSVPSRRKGAQAVPGMQPQPAATPRVPLAILKTIKGELAWNEGGSEYVVV